RIFSPSISKPICNHQAKGIVNHPEAFRERCQLRIIVQIEAYLRGMQTAPPNQSYSHPIKARAAMEVMGR
ncbi:MAG: hypothetical protein RMJ57_09080, partial [Bacteroidia bacterium]|nr:hypothetical protein [Bacteroidia bacterium]